MIVVRFPNGKYWVFRDYLVDDLQKARVFSNAKGAKCSLTFDGIKYDELEFLEVHIELGEP